jgi:DNA (cytosine-5)-methyltransferase 1
MNVLSLFSGVGGFDLGLENAGMKTIYQCEWDKHATGVLELHWPHVPRWGDITTLTAKEILRHGTPPDVVAWGSPCQDLSVAGKRAGLEGERSGLFHEGIRIINELRKETNNEYPKISIWENVAGALSSNRGADFGVILDEMAKAGAMVIEWGLLDAQHFGIPQRRRRVFVIAVFNSATANLCPSPLLPVGESLRGDTSKGKPKRKSAANTLTESFGAGGGIVNAIGASIYHKSTVVNQDVNCGHLVTEGGILGSDIVGSLNTSDAKMISTQYVNENKVVIEPYLSFDTQFGSNANVFEDQSPTLKASQAAPSVAYSVREDAKANTFSATELDHANALSALRPSPQSHHAQMFITEPMAVRRLTPLECERLMGWPDDHTRYKADGTEQADTHRYKQCGNGVASPVAEWIGKQLMKLNEASQ